MNNARLSRRHIAPLLVAAGAALSSPSLANKAGDTLRWASRYPIDALDPYYNTAREAIVINGQLVWDTLIWRDPQSGEYKPLLAREWKWIDDTTLEFTLRDDVKWHNGKPLTAHCQKPGGFAAKKAAAPAAGQTGTLGFFRGLAKWAADRVESGSLPEWVAQEAMNYLKQRVNGHGGMILLDAQGRYGIAHNTPRMAWAVRTAEKKETGIHREK